MVLYSYLIFEIFVGLKSNKKCRLRKATIYSTAARGISPACPALVFFCDDRPYWCLSTCKISWSLLLLFSHYKRLKVFKLNFLDVLPFRAFSNVKKSNLEFNSFPMTHCFMVIALISPEIWMLCGKLKTLGSHNSETP